MNPSRIRELRETCVAIISGRWFGTKVESESEVREFTRDRKLRFMGRDIFKSRGLVSNLH
jgi:hypothetical protein